MKIQYIKSNSNHHIAHLYEHIVCALIVESLFEAEILQFLHYGIQARTILSGIVFIEITVYDARHARAIKDCMDTIGNISNKSISTAMSQLIAETELCFDSTGFNDVKQALIALHSKPWVTGVDIEFVPSARKRRSDKILKATKEKLPAADLFINLTIYRADLASGQALSALFRQITRLFAENIDDHIAWLHGLYIADSAFHAYANKIDFSTHFLVPNEHDIKVTQILHDYRQQALRLMHQEPFDAFKAQLTGTDGLANTYLTPDTLATLSDTGVLVGLGGWQKLTTHQNVDHLLSVTEIEGIYTDTVRKLPLLSAIDI